jgi:hypothetical protein
VKDLPRRHIGVVERGRCPRAVLQTAPGQLWASTSWHYRPGREVLAGLGQVRAGNTRNNGVRIFPLTGDQGIGALPRPRKHGLELGLRDDESLGSEPRWNADRCAHPEGCAAVPGGTARGALRLSAFRFLFFLSVAKWAWRTGISRHHPFLFRRPLFFALQPWRCLQNSGVSPRRENGTACLLPVILI